MLSEWRCIVPSGVACYGSNSILLLFRFLAFALINWGGIALGELTTGPVYTVVLFLSLPFFFSSTVGSFFCRPNWLDS